MDGETSSQQVFFSFNAAKAAEQIKVFPLFPPVGCKHFFRLGKRKKYANAKGSWKSARNPTGRCAYLIAFLFFVFSAEEGITRILEAGAASS